MQVKLAIQNAKLLADATVLQFYPSMFVLVTDLLDNFGKLVFDRIKERGAGTDPKTGAQLPPLGNRFSHKHVSDLAKETCRCDAKVITVTSQSAYSMAS